MAADGKNTCSSRHGCSSSAKPHWIAFMYLQLDSHGVYYCPKCDRAVSKERLEAINEELRAKFDKDLMNGLRCPVCETEFIDLDQVHPEGGKHICGKRRIEK
jgi:hypothetical protein